MMFFENELLFEAASPKQQLQKAKAALKKHRLEAVKLAKQFNKIRSAYTKMAPQAVLGDYDDDALDPANSKVEKAIKAPCNALEKMRFWFAVDIEISFLNTWNDEGIYIDSVEISFNEIDEYISRDASDWDASAEKEIVYQTKRAGDAVAALKSLVKIVSSPAFKKMYTDEMTKLKELKNKEKEADKACGAAVLQLWNVVRAVKKSSKVGVTESTVTAALKAAMGKKADIDFRYLVRYLTANEKPPKHLEAAHVFNRGYGGFNDKAEKAFAAFLKIGASEFEAILTKTAMKEAEAEKKIAAQVEGSMAVARDAASEFSKWLKSDPAGAYVRDAANDDDDPFDVAEIAYDGQKSLKFSGSYASHDRDAGRTCAAKFVASMVDDDRGFDEIIKNLLQDVKNGHLHKRTLAIGLELVPQVIKLVQKKFASVEKDLEKKAEAPPKAPMGRIAFSPQRIDKAPYEPNTQKERDLYDSLVAHFDGAMKLDKNDVAMLRDFLKKGHYSPVIHEPKVSVVYRGMSVSKKWLQALLKKKSVPEKGALKKGGTYKIKKGEHSSSWSTKKSVAKKFANEAHEGEFTVIMTAAIDSNKNMFVSGPGGIYKLRNIGDVFKQEHECVGLGDIKINEISWEYNRNDW